MITKELLKRLKSTLGIEDETPSSEEAEFIVSRSPIDNSILGTVSSHSNDDYEAAISSSLACFARWRQEPLPKRAEILKALQKQISLHLTDLAQVLTIETGKPIKESVGEIKEIIDIIDYALGLGRTIGGSVFPSERARHTLIETWHPLGPIAVVTAFNFPMAVWGWNAVIGTLCGNTIIWKPSPKVSLCSLALNNIASAVARDAGFDGLFNLLIDSEHNFALSLAEDERIKLVSATGSTAMGRAVSERVARRFGKTILELGGNNAIIVTPSADIGLAVNYTYFAALGYQGQRCTSARRLIVHDSIKSDFVNALIEKYKTLKVGDPLDKNVEFGPLIDSKAVNSFEVAVTEGREKGTVLYGGEALKQHGSNYVTPCIIEMDYNETLTEKFIPVLYVHTYKELEEALTINNMAREGLSSAIFTNLIEEAEYFRFNSDCGLANVNVGTSGAEIGGAFGGEKETGGGRESGSDSWKGYMRRQTSVINWGRTMTLAQGINLNE